MVFREWFGRQWDEVAEFKWEWEYEYTGTGMGIDQWEWEGMGRLIVFPHTSNVDPSQRRCRPLLECRSFRLQYVTVVVSSENSDVPSVV